MRSIEQHLKDRYLQQRADAPKPQLPTIPANPTESPKPFTSKANVIRGKHVTIYLGTKATIKYDARVADSFRIQAYKHFEVTSKQMRESNRKVIIVEARRIIYASFVQLTNIKPAEYHEIFGQDRTTVIHAIQTHKDMLSVKGNDDYIRRFNAWMEAMSDYIARRNPQFKMVRK